MRFAALLKKPSALAPILMSAAAMLVLVAAWFTIGLVRQPDEGAYAHLWQLLMGLQVPIVAYFAIHWIPRAPKPALGVLALQLLAIGATAFPVYFFNL